MAQLGRLIVKQFPILQNHCLCACASFRSSPLALSLRRRFSSTTVHAARRSAAPSRARRLRSPSAPAQSDLRTEVAREEEEEEEEEEQSGGEFEASTYKSRNELKREARRAVKWGMDLAGFSVPQIKRILSVASLEKEVFEALVLVKKLGPDVREGKRRQFNYIGKLLREVEPELMDSLIRATKDGDHSTLQSLASSRGSLSEDSDQDYEATDSDEEEEGPHVDTAARWLDGLICKDTEIMNEIYSIRDVDFDRQELRKLVRRVHSMQEKANNAAEENKGEIDSGVLKATKSLTRFLRSLAKELPSDDC